jgi:uncharacterized protein (DUF1697 family)
MTKLAGLLRAVNVGGTGKLPMADLRAMCSDIGFTNVKTLLASGNVVFETENSQADAKDMLNAKLTAFFEVEIGLFMLNADEMSAVNDANPFDDHSPSQVGVLFVDHMPSEDDCKNAKGLADETLISGPGVLYVKYPSGMGKSRLIAPGSKTGTMRNMNTVLKLTTLLNE